MGAQHSTVRRAPRRWAVLAALAGVALAWAMRPRGDAVSIIDWENAS